jgi:hypothetical protein
VNLSQVPGVKGFWNVMSGSLIAPAGLPGNLTLDQVPFQDWARALYDYRQRRGGLDDPHARCQPAGGMRFFTVPNGMEFIDQPELNRIFIIDGENRDWRRIAMEPGRKHPPEDELIPSYFGDSIGRWEGDTLVVETTNFNDKTRLRYGGSSNTHAVERFTRLSPDLVDYRYTITDPTVFTKPFTVAIPMPRRTDKLYEYACHEGNHAMIGILAGARLAEKEAAAQAGSKRGSDRSPR